MAKKRRQVKAKIQPTGENAKPVPAKRPRRGAPKQSKPDTGDQPPEICVSVTSEEEIIECRVEKINGQSDELSVVTNSTSEFQGELVCNQQNDDEKDEPASEQASDSSDSSSDSDSSSSSDSESSDSDSKSGTQEATPAEPIVVEQLTNTIVNHNPVKQYPVKKKSSSSDSYHSDTEEEDKKRRKKQKNLQRQMLNKRARRVGRGSRSDALDDDEEEVAGNGDDVPDWPEEDFSELLRRIEEQLPSKDNLKFDSRAAKLDWNRIKFNQYTTDECYDVWSRISKRIRRFRTLSEMLIDARDWITKPWTNFYRGTKKNRHPDMPSRPLSTYMIYYLEHKDAVVAENPGLEMTQISKLISEQYKALTDVEKDKYTELAAKERQNFEEKLSEFYKYHPEMVPNQQPKVHYRDSHSKGPRKPSGPFKLFYQEQLKRYNEEGVHDRKSIEEMAKENWRGMSDKKKLVWITWALEDLKRYEDELQKYQQDHPDYVPPVAAKNVLNKDERAIKERLAGKPLKPPNSAYSLYSRFMLQSDEEVKSIPPKLRMAEISRKWKEISDAQKVKYEETVRELQEQYKLEFASYLETLSKEEREEELKKTQPKRKTTVSKVDPDPPAPSRRQPSRAAAGAARRNTARLPTPTNDVISLYKGEPTPPPVRAYDLFLQTFLAERPYGTTEAQRLKEAPGYWEILSESKKELYRNNLSDLKQKYIKDYEVFLKGLSPDELKEFSLLKAKSKKQEDDRENLTRGNGILSDSDDSESEKDESLSGSDSDVSDGSSSSDNNK